MATWADPTRMLSPLDDATSRFEWVREAVGQTLTRVWLAPGGTEMCRESFGVGVAGPEAGPAMLKLDDGTAPPHILRFDTLEQAMRAGEAHVALTYVERPTWRLSP